MAEATVGKCFETYERLASFVKEYQELKCVQLSVQSSVKIQSSKPVLKYSKLAIANKDLGYSSIKYKCIHGGNFKSKGDGHRNTQTFQQGCPFSLKFKLSPDGQKLMITELKEVHNHEISKEVFNSLPRQRTLDTSEKLAVQEMLALKCNKKLIKQHIVSSMSKLVTLKDLHNMKAHEKNNLQDTVQYLESLGGYVEVLESEGKLEGIFFQDPTMKSVFAANPEVLLLDATYCLNNLYMPLYILMVLNGNGQGQVAGLFLLAHETTTNISIMLNIFRKINPKSDSVEVIFTDKDFSERGALRNVFPHATLLLCFFHTLKTFKSKVTCTKMSLSSDERKKALHILQKLAYAKDELEYETHYTELLSINNKNLEAYFNTNWHPIRYEWVRGFMKKEKTFNITTTNHLESFNQKIKQVVVRNSNLLTFFKDLMAVLESTYSEQKQKAITMMVKKSTQYATGSVEDYYKSQLTPYAWGLVSKELEEANRIEFCFEAGATNEFCDCMFFKNTSLPCKHIFFKRKEAGLELKCEDLIHEKFKKTNHYKAFTDNLVGFDTHSSQIQSLPPPNKTKVLSKQEKYKKAMEICNDIANILSDYGSDRFYKSLDELNDFKSSLLPNQHQNLEVDPENQIEEECIEEECIEEEYIEEEYIEEEYVQEEYVQEEYVHEVNMSAVSSGDVSCTRSKSPVDQSIEIVEIHNVNASADSSDCKPDDTNSRQFKTSLKDISLNGMCLKRRGRPKGADTTVVGLKRRK